MGALPIVVDPPSGWKYGFPRVWDPVKQPSIKQWFLDNGYPEKDIDLALKYSRYWSVPEGEE